MYLYILKIIYTFRIFLLRLFYINNLDHLNNMIVSYSN